MYAVKCNIQSETHKQTHSYGKTRQRRQNTIKTEKLHKLKETKLKIDKNLKSQTETDTATHINTLKHSKKNYIVKASHVFIYIKKII